MRASSAEAHRKCCIRSEAPRNSCWLPLAGGKLPSITPSSDSPYDTIDSSRQFAGWNLDLYNISSRVISSHETDTMAGSVIFSVAPYHIIS